MRNEYYLIELENLVKEHRVINSIELEYTAFHLRETLEGYEKDLEKTQKELEFWQNRVFDREIEMIDKAHELIQDSIG